MYNPQLQQVPDTRKINEVKTITLLQIIKSINLTLMLQKHVRQFIYIANDSAQATDVVLFVDYNKYKCQIFMYAFFSAHTMT